ncbi:hypothetical protein GCM10022271_06270 [Corallibacter vietnamensis]|uniref:Uncharacterized protein n=1 Tax=Corallibacter vietnamensis TaxID=904130 RepID=A0ABP7GXK9_9FLAO
MVLIKYKRKRLIFNLCLGLAWLSLGIVGILYGEVKWNDYFTIFLGLFYLFIYLYEQKKQYITLTKDAIKENALFGKSILIKDINKIITLPESIKIKTKNNKELTINTQLIDISSKIKLDSEIERLNQSLN